MIITDKPHWASVLRKLIEKKQDGSCVIWVEKSSDLFAGYALLDPSEPTLEKLIDAKSVEAYLDERGWKFQRNGVYFEMEEIECSKQSNSQLTYIEDFDDLSRLGTALFFLVWKPMLETVLPEQISDLQRRLQETESLLNRMVKIKQKVSMIRQNNLNFEMLSLGE